MSAILEFLKKHVSAIVEPDAQAKCERRLNDIFVKFEKYRRNQTYKAGLEMHYMNAEAQFEAGQYDACQQSIDTVIQILGRMDDDLAAIADRAEQVLPLADQAKQVASEPDQKELERITGIFNFSSSVMELDRPLRALDALQKLSEKIIREHKLIRGPEPGPLTGVSEADEDFAALQARAVEVLAASQKALAVAGSEDKTTLQKTTAVYEQAVAKKAVAQANKALDVLQKLSANVIKQSTLIRGPNAETLAEVSEAPEDFQKLRTLLAARLQQALPLDGENKLADLVAFADSAFEDGNYINAITALDNAGQLATSLITGADTYTRQDGTESQKKPVGAAKAPKTKGLDAATRANDQRNVYYADTPEKRAASAVHLDQHGYMQAADGKPLDGTQGFVTDAADGSMHVFDPKGKKEGRVLHHSSEVAGGDVTAAGEQTTEKGVIREIRDQSGHYRPDAEMTHQHVQSLKEKGARMRDETIVELDEDGDWTEADSATQRDYKDVQKLPKLREKLAKLEKDRTETPQTEENADRIDWLTDEIDYYKRRIKNAESVAPDLRARGVGPSNVDAEVELYNPSTRFTAEEWETVKGNQPAIQKLIMEKVGMKLPNGVPFPWKFASGAQLDPNSMENTNDFIGTLLRASEVPGFEFYADKSQTHVRMRAEQFAQTGGNLDAVKKKKSAANELLDRRIAALGGAAKLREIGVADPSKYSKTELIDILEAGELPAPEKLEDENVDEEFEVFKCNQLSVCQDIANKIGMSLSDLMKLDPNGSLYVNAATVADELQIDMKELFQRVQGRPVRTAANTAAPATTAAVGHDDSDDDDDDASSASAPNFDNWKNQGIDVTDENARKLGLSVAELQRIAGTSGYIFPNRLANEMNLSEPALFARMTGSVAAASSGAALNDADADASPNTTDNVLRSFAGEDEDRAPRNVDDDLLAAADNDTEPPPDFERWKNTGLPGDARTARKLGMSLTDWDAMVDELGESYPDMVAKKLGITEEQLFDKLYG
jgi:hypothetical protein